MYHAPKCLTKKEFFKSFDFSPSFVEKTEEWSFSEIVLSAFANKTEKSFIEWGYILECLLNKSLTTNSLVFLIENDFQNVKKHTEKYLFFGFLFKVKRGVANHECHQSYKNLFVFC